MIKYPRYTRKQNLSCKLTDKNIVMIRQLYKKGISMKAIAKKYEMSISSIWYWLLTNKERKEKNKKRYLKYDKNRDLSNKRKRQLKSVKRKCHLMTIYKEYRRQLFHRRYLRYKKMVKNNK